MLALDQARVEEDAQVVAYGRLAEADEIGDFFIEASGNTSTRVSARPASLLRSRRKSQPL